MGLQDSFRAFPYGHDNCLLVSMSDKPDSVSLFSLLDFQTFY